MAVVLSLRAFQFFQYDSWGKKIFSGTPLVITVCVVSSIHDVWLQQKPGCVPLREIARFPVSVNHTEDEEDTEQTPLVIIQKQDLKLNKVSWRLTMIEIRIYNITKVKL